MTRDFKYFHKITPIVFRFCGVVFFLLLTPRGVIPKSWFSPKFCVISVLGPRDFYSQWKLLDASHHGCRHLGGTVYTRWKSGSCFFCPLLSVGWSTPSLTVGLAAEATLEKNAPDNSSSPGGCMGRFPRTSTCTGNIVSSDVSWNLSFSKRKLHPHKWIKHYKRLKPNINRMKLTNGKPVDFTASLLSKKIENFRKFWSCHEVRKKLKMNLMRTSLILNISGQKRAHNRKTHNPRRLQWKPGGYGGKNWRFRREFGD